MRYQPQQFTLVDGWIPASYVDEQPIAYATLEEAVEDLRDYIDSGLQSGVAIPSPDELRIVDLLTHEVHPYHPLSDRPSGDGSS